MYLLDLTQPSSKQIICFDFEKQNSVLPYNIRCTWADTVHILHNNSIGSRSTKEKEKQFVFMMKEKF